MQNGSELLMPLSTLYHPPAILFFFNEADLEDFVVRGPVHMRDNVRK